MKTDKDLQFLQNCDNEDLRSLCDILVFNNDGKVRFNESLTRLRVYNTCYPDNMQGMWRELALELQRYGGNSILNFICHGVGPSYKSIVYEVCKRIKVSGISIQDTTEELEQKLLVTISSKAIGQLTEAQARAIMLEYDIQGFAFTKKGLFAALLAFQVVNRHLFVAVINSVMKTVYKALMGSGILAIGIGAFAARGIGLCMGAVGWLVFAGWTAWNLMGPSYSVVVPAVIQIAYMRTKMFTDLSLR